MKEEKRPIHIFGHVNPDTDSTCAAISYAYLKNEMDSEHSYIPATLGEINTETAYVLERFQVEKPMVLQHLKPEVKDIILKDLSWVYQKASIKNVLETMSSQIGRAVPVVDEQKRLTGILSISDIVPMLLKTTNRPGKDNIEIPIKNIIETLSLIPVRGEIKGKNISGKFYILNELSEDIKANEEDVILCSHYDYLNGSTKGLKAGYIIVAGNKKEEELITEESSSAVVLASEKNLYELIQEISYALPITDIVRRDNLEYFTTYETIDDVKKNMMTSKYRRFPVVNEGGVITGMISRSNLLDVDQKKVILVDHNERGQSIEGIDEITIVEVIDHHRVSDVQTISPLYFRVEPVGSTCTIIGKIFEENNIPIPKKIAGLMLSGILSDTLVYKSPTCTQTDIDMAEKLAQLLQINAIGYGMKLVMKGEGVQDKKPDEIIATDRKRFTFGEYQVAISQIMTGDFEGIYQIYPEILEAMKESCSRDNLDLSVLLLTNIVLGGTEIIAVGDARWIAENAFNMSKNDVSIFLPDVFSRKKQIVPKLMKSAHL